MHNILGLWDLYNITCIYGLCHSDAVAKDGTLFLSRSEFILADHWPGLRMVIMNFWREIEARLIELAV